MVGRREGSFFSHFFEKLSFRYENDKEKAKNETIFFKKDCFIKI